MDFYLRTWTPQKTLVGATAFLQFLDSSGKCLLGKFLPWLRYNREKKSRFRRFLELGFSYQKWKFSFSLMKYTVISDYFKNDISKSVKFRDFFSLL